MRNRYWLDGMMGAVVGDALGLPVQFMDPEEIAVRPQGPVNGMEGQGCFNMPEGSWSDDSSLALATLDSINVKGRVDAEDIMVNFVKWLYKGEYTPFGFAYDIGFTCEEAITRFAKNPDIETSGRTGEHANGNGALMRIMPVCLHEYDLQKNEGISDKEAVETVHRVASLTHNHLRSNMACGLYFFMVREILDHKAEKTLMQCLQDGLDKGFWYYGADAANHYEMDYYKRLFYLDEFIKVPVEEVSFSGYVVNTIEAAVWCLIQENNYRETLLKVVNRGEDSDSVGAVAGGLAGLYYGYDDIPKEWLDVIQRRDWIEKMAMLEL